MKSIFLLIVLSQNGAGDITASFVNTDTAELCQQKSLLIEGIFSSANIPVIERRCIQSDLIFSPFGHAESTSQKRHFYTIQFTGDSVHIKAVENWQQCNAIATQGASSSHIYCSSSLQQLQ